MAAGISLVLIIAVVLMGLCFIGALILVLVVSAKNKGSWTPPPRDVDGHQYPDR
ncbi:hypothetical protein IPV09_11675 [Tessaracoccus sp. SD287]|uniref:hypothetical protein n=1 Tax=Tessaracoccus sp. SD287 TaxID=2782008 RepID=UPI001A9757B9|nr:hypothetical protein [Tessaracoccus sp. SD287]MBO1031995.1 hypothetical protein [Tessaracoccus sp. SD287]